MANLQLADRREWLSLREACDLLQVSQATLRQWADAGHVGMYRTPGGHRRFAREDLLAMTRQPAARIPARTSRSARNGGPGGGDAGQAGGRRAAPDTPPAES